MHLGRNARRDRAEKKKKKKEIQWDEITPNNGICFPFFCLHLLSLIIPFGCLRERVSTFTQRNMPSSTTLSALVMWRLLSDTEPLVIINAV